MSRQVIVVGDTLAPYDGKVITGSGADIVDGKAVARKPIWWRARSTASVRSAKGIRPVSWTVNQSHSRGTTLAAAARWSASPPLCRCFKRD